MSVLHQSYLNRQMNDVFASVNLKGTIANLLVFFSSLE